jgi:hypothetical protein
LASGESLAVLCGNTQSKGYREKDGIPILELQATRRITGGEAWVSQARLRAATLLA